MVGEIIITDRQAKKLELKPYTQLSPLLEKNCLLLGGNESFQAAEQDIKALTGIEVSHSTLQTAILIMKSQLELSGRSSSRP